MSNRTKFILGIIALLALFFVLEYQMPRKFQWVPTFAHSDPQPFGCLVFDSVLKASMPNGYTVERRTLWQMEKDSVFTTPKAVIIITEEDIDAQIKKVLDLANRGNTMLVATSDLYHWTDTLGIDYNYQQLFNVVEIAGKKPEKGLLFWKSNTLCGVPVYKQLIERTLEIPDSVSCKVLATFANPSKIKGHITVQEDTVAPKVHTRPAVAVSFSIGKGELILVSSPLLLTNYMMVSGNGHQFIAWLMNRLKDRPVIRTESYMKITATEQQSPFYVLLQEPPLRWALYLSMLAVVLFCFVTARRRQRVIPVVTKPQNGNLEFVRLVGTLYWQQHDNAGLLAKKLAFTIDELRRQTGIDITSDNESIGQLASQIGRDTEELRLLLRNIRQAASGNYAVSDAELKTFIYELDSLIL